MKKVHCIGLFLLLFCFCCRWFTPVADFYATRLYPGIMTALSFAASIVPFSLEEMVVLGFAGAFLLVLAGTLLKKKSFFRWLGKSALVVMWLAVWFYLGWGCNYFRTPLLPRLGIQKQLFLEDTFNQFLYSYTDSLNKVYAPQREPFDRDSLEADIRSFYQKTLPESGYAKLRAWQHPKRPLLNRLYSAVGVTGFMGPFFCEVHVNRDVLETDWPFTLAHEMAHLSGVTSEAEANYWAYVYCTRSQDDRLRYSGYYSILPHVITSVRSYMTEEYFRYWIRTINLDIREEYAAEGKYWEEKRIGWIDRIQSWLMDTNLKQNGVSSGAREYNEVVGLIITMEASGR